MERYTPPTKSRSGGFTLPEVLIATGLVATCVASLAGVLDAVYQNERFVQNQARALQASRQLLEEVVALPVIATAAGQTTVASMDCVTDSISLAPGATDAVLVMSASGSAALIPISATNIGTIGINPNTRFLTPTPAATPVEVVSSESKAMRMVTVSTGAVTIAGQSINSSALRVVKVEAKLPNGQIIQVQRIATSAEQTR